MKKHITGNGSRKTRKKELKDKPLPVEVKKLAKRLKEIRLAKGYKTFEDFAYTNDITTSQYFAYEKGKNMEFVTLVRILKAMGITLKEFFSEGFD